MIINVTWSIDPVSQLLTGATVFAQPDSPTSAPVRFFITIFVSCSGPGKGGPQNCTGGRAVLTFPASKTLPPPQGIFVPFSPKIDPELRDIHDIKVLATTH